MNITGNDINYIFGTVYQKYRIEKNLTQENLAEALSKSAKTVSQYETRKKWHK